MARMDQSQAEYLREVLGVESWIGAVQDPITPKVVAVFKEVWSKAELSLAEKILAATLPTIQVVLDDPDSLTQTHLVLFDTEARPDKSIRGEQTLWNLGPLKNLMTGTPAEIQANKREVWNLLKQLKEAI